MARETILISSEESDQRTTLDDASDGTSRGSDGYSANGDTSSDYDTNDSFDRDRDVDHDPILALRGKVLYGWSDIK